MTWNPSDTKSFRTRADFRRWLERNHATVKELVIRLFKVHAAHRGMGYRDALDEALCFGWIDGVRRSLDEDSFAIRFTPRKPKSYWSRVNIKRFGELEVEGRVRPPGAAAFRSSEGQPRRYSFEQDEARLEPAFLREFRAAKRAWAFFAAQPPGYRKTATAWVMSARRPETRRKRFDVVRSCSARGERIPLLARPAAQK